MSAEFLHKKKSQWAVMVLMHFGFVMFDVSIG